jgi:hypothetical protein
MPSEFEMRIVLPDKAEPQGQVYPLDLIDTSDWIDDPDHPLFLTEACSIFAARGVRFQIIGFFEEPLPVSADDDLVFLLEELPSLFAFLEDESSTQFELGFWSQGIETVFLFTRLANGEIFEVNYSSGSKFALARRTERISRSQLIGQILAIVDAYHEALRRFLPGKLSEPWNQKIFAAAGEFKKSR